MQAELIPVITLDGPSGTGKGTLCHRLARHLGWHLLDSGLFYRVLPYAAHLKNILLTDTKALLHLAKTMDVVFETNKVLLDGKNVYEAIRTEKCGQDASIVGANPEIRQALLERQRSFAKAPGLVTDGRDMGTVVFPDAIIKIFLYADEEERAKRRYLELKEKGIDVSLPKVFDELVTRDKRDSARTHAPLKPADDAILIDTTGLTIAQVFQHVLELLAEHSYFVENAGFPEK